MPSSHFFSPRVLRRRALSAQIDELMRKHCANPVFVIIDVRPDVDGIPTTGYVSVEEVVEGDGKEIQRTFKHIPSSIGAYEAEEVGVEHLLRDVNDASSARSPIRSSTR